MKASVLMQRLYYPTETVLSNKITRKDSQRQSSKNNEDGDFERMRETRVEALLSATSPPVEPRQRVGWGITSKRQ